jgi:type IV pilus assembly protein PilX
MKSTFYIRNQNQGIALVVVLLILAMVSMLGVASIQISKTATQSARNERDTQVAWQSAEAALLDAELDILGKPASSTKKRGSIFENKNTDTTKFIDNCGQTGDEKGLCTLNQENKLAWLAINFLESDSSKSKYVEFGDFTGRKFSAGNTGIQPALKPRYIIELIDDPNIERTQAQQYRKYVFRVTAIGFGPSKNTQVVLQTIYRN